MSVISYIIVFTLIGSLFSLIGGVLLLLKQNFTLRISHLLSAFAAGTLLSSALFDLLPEAQHHAESMELAHRDIFIWMLIGILAFFLLERFIHWFHHSHVHDHEEKHTVPLIVVGDSLHNIVDGVVIAITFMTSIPLGIITTLAVAAHEIPQEIGDFAVLLKKGLSNKKVLVINIVSALLSLASALITFFVGERITNLIPYALSLTAGFFIYIALSDLIPSIHHENRRGFAFYESLMLFLGVLLIAGLVTFLHPGH